MHRPSKVNKVKNRKYLCSTAGMLGPNAVCGNVSVFSDEKGHRCMAHGKRQCKHKIELLVDKNGVEYEKGGQYVDQLGNVCFLDYIDEDGVFSVFDGESPWFVSTLSVSEFTSGKVYV